MKMSRHALRRWRQRFPDLDFNEEFEKARPATENIRKLIRKQCLQKGCTIRKDSNLQYLANKATMIIFIYAEDEDTVVTVFPYRK